MTGYAMYLRAFTRSRYGGMTSEDLASDHPEGLAGAALGTIDGRVDAPPKSRNVVEARIAQLLEPSEGPQRMRNGGKT